MPGTFSAMILMTAMASGHPIPAGPPADPLRLGYIGFYPVDTQSLVIDRVEDNTPASRAGLRPGDKFVQIGNSTPKTFDQLRAYVSGFRPGTVIKLTIDRGGKQISLVMTLAARPVESGFPFPVVPNEP